MARGIVQSKPFVKPQLQSTGSTSKIAGFSRKRKIGKSELATFLVQKYFLAGTIILIALFMLLFLLKGTLYNTSYQIENINYPASTRAHYENTELFVLTSKLLRGKFYSALQVGGVGGILEQIQASYPFVRALDIKHTDQKTISVEYQFSEPDFLVKMNGKRYGVWQDGYTEELNESWILGQGAFLVDTPQYLSGTNSMSGFFYDVSYDRYQKAIPLIKENFPNMKRFVYLVGSKNFMIFDEKKLIYLHRDSLKHQLEKYQWLKKHFANFDGVYEIDL